MSLHRPRGAHGALTLVVLCTSACASTPPGLPPTGSGAAATSTPTATAPRSPIAAAPPPRAVADDTLPPRRAYSGNPDYAAVQLSPDGKSLSYLAPLDGVMNVWVAPVDTPTRAEPLTRARERPIRQYFWAEDDRHLLFLQDTGGDEDFHLYKVDVRARTPPVDLTPEPKVRAQVIGLSARVPGSVVIGLNARDARHHDVVRIELATGRRTLLLQNDQGYSGFEVDLSLELRLASLPRADGGVDHRLRQGTAFVPLVSVAHEDTVTTQPLGFDQAGRLYFLDSRERNTAALTQVDLKTGAGRVLAEDPRADAEAVLTHPVTGAPQAVSFDELRPEWTVVDAAIAADLGLLRDKLRGVVQVASRSRDDARWVVVASVDDGSPVAYLYQRKTKALTPLVTYRSALARVPLTRMLPRRLQARDGLPLISYLSLPRGSDPDGDGVPDAPLPMVLSVHGGPWSRDRWGYNATHQWLASRGYAVLSVNYRGSTGYGKAFVNASTGEWGGKMHDDLLDAVAWAVAERIADPARVAIRGGSYGGYATLVGLSFTPTTFACGVDLVGPSNLVTLLSTIPAYWAPMLEMMVRRIGGDPRTEEGRRYLTSRSPLSYAHKIERPLLIGQGANDPRVKQAESDQIVAALQAARIPVTYALYPDEGHGFARPENRLSFDAISELFLAECLGGRYQPLGDDLRGSTVTVPVGAEVLAPLPAALAAPR